MASPIVVGTIRDAYGVRGWVKVQSYTQPATNIARYTPWVLRHRGGEQTLKVLSGKQHGDDVVVQLDGISDRDAALALKGAEIIVQREALPPLTQGEFYWVDLIGLDVVTTNGVKLGAVIEMMETGSNDVLVVRGERDRLIPFLRGTVVKDVDLSARRVTVDWDSEM